MTLDRLKTLLPDALRPKVPALYGDFREAYPKKGVSDFLTHLHEIDLIDVKLYRTILMSADDSITLSGYDELTGGGLEMPLSMVGMLGRGAMGEVFVARDVGLQRNVAVKRLYPNMNERLDLVRRFFMEVQVTAQLEHPGIPPVHALETDENGVPSYTMKLVRGRTLKQYIIDAIGQKESGTVDAEHSLAGRLESFLKICDAVDYAHSRGVLHRDLKPANIMVGAFHQVMVMDWGIARIIDGEDTVALSMIGAGTMKSSGDQPADLTAVGELLGTPAYMSPEQAQGRNDELTGASDQYALGLILFELAALRRARKPGGATLMAAAMGKRETFTEGERGKDVDAALKAIIRKATDPDPVPRYRTVGDLAADVRRYMRDESIEASPDNALQRLQRWLSRHRLLTLTIILGLVLAVFAVGTLTMMSGAAALEAHRQASERREARLADVRAAVDGQGRVMSDTIYGYQSLLSGIATAAEHAMVGPAHPTPYFLESAYHDPETAPDDLQMSLVYGAPVSATWPDISLGRGVQEKQVADTIYRLASMMPHLHRAQVQSSSDSAVSASVAERRKLIVDTGVPIVWAYIATEDGVMVSSPGSGTIDDDDYEMREMSWYTEQKASRAPLCDTAGVDESGLGILLTCSSAIRDLDDAFIGVAGVDVTFAYFIENLLDPPDLGAPVEAYLIDKDNRVQMRSGLKDKARSATEWELEDFPYAAALAGQGESGALELAGPDGEDLLITWTPVPSMGWSYAVVGQADALLR